MQENYYSWSSWVKRLSKSEIRKMKENMRKTPLVQEKSEKYHNIEVEKAEDLLNQIEEDKITIKPTKKSEEKKVWWVKKIYNYLFW